MQVAHDYAAEPFFGQTGMPKTFLNQAFSVFFRHSARYDDEQQTAPAEIRGQSSQTRRSATHADVYGRVH
jgi:hypothetical protein